MEIRIRRAEMLVGLVGLVALTGLNAQTSSPQPPSGRSDLQGIWQALNSAEWNLEPHEGRPGIPPGMGVVEGGLIPYQPWAAAKRQENFQRRETEDPVSKCYLPGVPRATYMGFPFQILQSDRQVLMLHEYAHTVRVIPTTGKSFRFNGVEFWMWST